MNGNEKSVLVASETGTELLGEREHSILLVLVHPTTGEVVNADNIPCCPFCGHTFLTEREYVDADDADAGYQWFKLCKQCKGEWRMG